MCSNENYSTSSRRRRYTLIRRRYNILHTLNLESLLLKELTEVDINNIGRFAQTQEFTDLNRILRYRTVKENVSSKILCFEQFNNKHAQSIFHSLRLGSAPLKMWLYKINLSDSPRCHQCKHPTETIDHYIMQCKQFKEERYTLLNCFKDVLNHKNRIYTNDVLLSVGTIKGLSHTNITKLYKAAIQYIAATRRFDSYCTS